MNFVITNCDLTDIITEIIRFLSHITFLHLINAMIDKKETLFEINYIKVMLFTALSVIFYHITVKKLINNKVKKMRKLCEDTTNKNANTKNGTK